MILKKENISSKNSLKKRISFSIWLVRPWFGRPILTNGKRRKNNKTYPYSLGKLFILYLLFIPKWFLLLASTITICNIALLSSTETGRKFSICHTVKPVMERGGYCFYKHYKIILNNHPHNSYNNYFWFIPIIALTVENSNNPLNVWLRKYL